MPPHSLLQRRGFQTRRPRLPASGACTQRVGLGGRLSTVHARVHAVCTCTPALGGRLPTVHARVNTVCTCTPALGGRLFVNDYQRMPMGLQVQFQRQVTAQTLAHHYTQSRVRDRAHKGTVPQKAAGLSTGTKASAVNTLWA